MILEEQNQFDWYDGGGLDVAVLSFAEFDQEGNVNVSRFGERVNGVGGFINISQATPKVVFVGTLTAGGLCTSFQGETLCIDNEGKIKKAVKHVEQISFSAKYAKKQKQKILYITERAVFELTDQGVELKEIAPGIDLQREVLDQMEFQPLISEKLKVMTSVLFREEKMKLYNHI